MLSFTTQASMSKFLGLFSCVAFVGVFLLLCNFVAHVVLLLMLLKVASDMSDGRADEEMRHETMEGWFDLYDDGDADVEVDPQEANYANAEVHHLDGEQKTAEGWFDLYKYDDADEEVDPQATNHVDAEVFDVSDKALLQVYKDGCELAFVIF
eukprot:TRINITY_DN33535_c0_g1_i1.p1 TRINITY_DN33535_c0_g1~~TRINITY_DN33535_c0_g1_i1.p1  ORF type:complete len:153 (+),score=29.69 TRINITY_DN33535_c0_g1_i1:89-547(+)